jgi:hypothetical protein
MEWLSAMLSTYKQVAARLFQARIISNLGRLNKEMTKRQLGRTGITNPQTDSEAGGTVSQ